MSYKTACSRLMPSAIPHEYLMASSPTRKRRREDNGEVQTPFNSTLEAAQNRFSAINNNERLSRSSSRGSASPFSVPRKVIALPVSKKFRLVEDSPHEQLPSHYLHHNDFPPSALSQSQQSHFSHAHPDQNSAAFASASPHQTRPAVARANSSALLSPCHICHRKPTKKSDLDSFGDCTGCGERTCFVCLRACRGWLSTSEGTGPNHAPAEAEDLSASFTMQDVDDDEGVHNDVGRTIATLKPHHRQKKGEGGGDGDKEVGSWNGRGHRSVICSRCCVEQGSEGDVVCLGCLAGMEGV